MSLRWEKFFLQKFGHILNFQKLFVIFRLFCYNRFSAIMNYCFRFLPPLFFLEMCGVILLCGARTPVIFGVGQKSTFDNRPTFWITDNLYSILPMNCVSYIHVNRKHNGCHSTSERRGFAIDFTSRVDSKVKNL